jgi:hypothetical protein
MKCPKCSFETESEQGFRTHMSKTHKGYSESDLKSVGLKPNQRDIARGLAGNQSSKEVTDTAPDSEPKIGEAGAPATRTRRTKAQMQQEDPEVAAAKERILRARCSRMASLPYTLLAKLVGDDAVKLSPEEEADLTESYICVARSYGWEGTSKLILWGDVMICHAAIVMDPERKKAIFDAVNAMGQPEAVLEQTEGDIAADEIEAAVERTVGRPA